MDSSREEKAVNGFLAGGAVNSFRGGGSSEEMIRSEGEKNGLF